MIDWIVHLCMTKDIPVHAWGNFKKFKILFDSVKWQEKESKGYPESLFCYDTLNHESGLCHEFHAGKIMFYRSGMFLDPISWYLALYYKHRYIKNNFRSDKTKFNWSYAEIAKKMLDEHR